MLNSKTSLVNLVSRAHGDPDLSDAMREAIAQIKDNTQKDGRYLAANVHENTLLALSNRGLLHWNGRRWVLSKSFGEIVSASADDIVTTYSTPNLA